MGPLAAAFRRRLSLDQQRTLESPESLVTLLRDPYTQEFQLVVASKASGTRARAASREAIRLDDLEAPRCEADQRIKDAAADRARQSKTRDANRAAFRP